MWKGLNECRETLRKETCRQIGNGHNTKVWGDPWVIGNSNLLVRPNLDTVINSDLKVRDLMLFQPISWNIPLVQNLFDDETTINI